MYGLKSERENRLELFSGQILVRPADEHMRKFNYWNYLMVMTSRACRFTVKIDRALRAAASKTGVCLAGLIAGSTACIVENDSKYGVITNNGLLPRSLKSSADSATSC